MNSCFFGAHAPLYWASALPIIPLNAKTKVPAIPRWQEFGHRMPDENEQARWLVSHPSANLGLLLGAASGLCIIDIDTEDDGLIAAIREICGPTPWVRVGRKGMALAYRWEGQSNFKLRGADGSMICELLGQGNQCVVPPSIHPDTLQPYTANANLWEVLEEVPGLGPDIEDRLRLAIGLPRGPNRRVSKVAKHGEGRFSRFSRHLDVELARPLPSACRPSALEGSDSTIACGLSYRSKATYPVSLRPALIRKPPLLEIFQA